MLVLFSLFFCLLCSSAFPWGESGHKIIVQIAEKELTAKTQEEIAKILGNHTLTEYARWADAVKRDSKIYFHTRPWHYSNLAGKSYFALPTPKEGDAVQAFVKMFDILSSPQSSAFDKEVALKFIIHLTGDIHNPFHIGDAIDNGGNDVTVFWEGKKTNLHSVWDTHIVEHQKMGVEHYAQELHKTLTQTQRQRFVDSSILNWMNESNAIFAQNNRAPYHFQGLANMAEDYSARYIKDINKMMLRSGTRLGSVLNQIFDPQSVSSEIIKKRSTAHQELKRFWGPNPLKNIELPSIKQRCSINLTHP